MHGPGLGYGLRLQHVVFDAIVFAGIREVIARPDAVHHIEPFAGARVAIIVLLEVHAVFASFVRPPRRDHVERHPAAADVIDVGRLLGQQRRKMERGADGDHQFNALRHCSQCRSRRPCIQRIRLYTLDVVQIQFRDQRHVKTNLLAALRQSLHVRPARFHLFVGDIAQPSAETPEANSRISRLLSAKRLRLDFLAGCFRGFRDQKIR